MISTDVASLNSLLMIAYAGSERSEYEMLVITCYIGVNLWWQFRVDLGTSCKEVLLESKLIIKTREGWFQGEYSSRCALYAVTWLGINECVGKDLDLKPNPKPLRSFSIENKTSPCPEVIPNRVQNRGRELKRDEAGRYISPSKQGRWAVIH